MTRCTFGSIVQTKESCSCDVLNINFMAQQGATDCVLYEQLLCLKLESFALECLDWVSKLSFSAVVALEQFLVALLLVQLSSNSFCRSALGMRLLDKSGAQ